VERGSASPVHPFFDRGFTLWGELLDGTVTYDLGVYTGVGTEVDVPSGDVDSGKEWAARLFLRPFLNRDDSVLRGLIFVLGSTWQGESVPANRIEGGGFRSANYGSALWRWRTEQTLGTDGRATDRVAAQIAGRRRLGGELHYVRGPLALSTELLDLRFENVFLYHDFFVGSTRTIHQPLLERSGSVRSWSTWGSYYLTGESKRLEDSGWRTARPGTAWGEDGPGAWEVLARYSRTWSEAELFDAVKVAGFAPGSPDLPAQYGGATPGAGNSLSAAVLDGAHHVNEVTLGLNWTVNPMVRIQLNEVLLWAPSSDRNEDGVNDNFLVSGAKTAQSDPDRKFRKSKWENAVILRFIFKL
jgi:hypothetical protein